MDTQVGKGFCTQFWLQFAMTKVHVAAPRYFPVTGRRQRGRHGEQSYPIVKQIKQAKKQKSNTTYVSAEKWQFGEAFKKKYFCFAKICWRLSYVLYWKWGFNNSKNPVHWVTYMSWNGRPIIHVFQYSGPGLLCGTLQLQLWLSNHRNLQRITPKLKE